MIKKALVIVGVIGLLGGTYAYMQFNKEHRDIEGEVATLEVTAVDLFDAYVLDEKAANVKYLDKVVAVSGAVLEVDKANKMLVLKTNDDFGSVNASFEDVSGWNDIKEGAEVRLKGHCTGGDDLGVVITHCSILN